MINWNARIVSVAEDVAESKAELLARAAKADNGAFWVIAECAHKYHLKGGTDKKFADELGLSQQSVNKYRRCFEAFYSGQSTLSLGKQHYLVAIGWFGQFPQETRESLEWASRSGATAGEMQAHHVAKLDAHMSYPEEHEEDAVPCETAASEATMDEEEATAIQEPCPVCNQVAWVEMDSGTTCRTCGHFSGTDEDEQFQYDEISEEEIAAEAARDNLKKIELHFGRMVQAVDDAGRADEYRKPLEAINRLIAGDRREVRG